MLGEPTTKILNRIISYIVSLATPHYFESSLEKPLCHPLKSPMLFTLNTRTSPKYSQGKITRNEINIKDVVSGLIIPQLNDRIIPMGPHSSQESPIPLYSSRLGSAACPLTGVKILPFVPMFCIILQSSRGGCGPLVEIKYAAMPTTKGHEPEVPEQLTVAILEGIPVETMSIPGA